MYFNQFLKKMMFVAMATASIATHAQAADPIKIGAVLSVTGPAAFLGDPELKTLKLYVEKINAQGGLLGRPLQLVHYDDGSEASKANTFTNRLINNDKVDVLIGGTTTGSTMSAAPLAERAKIPFISCAGGVPITEPTKKYVFKTPPTDRMAAEKVFIDMKKRGLTKVALLSETSGFGQSGRKEALAYAKNHGINIIADETYGPKDTDVSAQLTKIKNLNGVQAIFVFGLGQGPAIVTKNYGQLGIKLPLYQSHGVASDEYIKLSGAAAEGVRLPSPPLLVWDKLPANAPAKKAVAEYSKSYTEKYKTDPSSFGGYAYDGLMLYVNAVKTAKSVDKEAVRNALEHTKGFIGTSGVVNMKANDHMGLDLSSFYMLEVKNKDWTFAK